LRGKADIEDASMSAFNPKRTFTDPYFSWRSALYLRHRFDGTLAGIV
jgi:hypothetical protein